MTGRTCPPYVAMETLGRAHPDSVDPSRDPFELDRHRITAGSAFRRLQYKTQVFVYDEHDHFRTRLTHTVEVAQIARRLASALHANETLAESIALAHDLGHPPFGHSGESTLADLMADCGGFEHNMHALRIVDLLEHPNPDFRGLNLTYEVREGLIKHATEYDKPDASVTLGLDIRELLQSGSYPTLEAQLVSLADRIAYDCHDLEDAIGAHMITAADLQEFTLWSEAAAPVLDRHPNTSIFAIRRPILDSIHDRLIDDGIRETKERLESTDPGGVDDVRAGEQPVAAFSDALMTQIREMEAFLMERVYRHHRLVRMDAKGRRIIERLFKAFVREPGMLPPRFAARIDAQGPQRVVCDYIAGMTDRYCRDEHGRLFDERVSV